MAIPTPSIHSINENSSFTSFMITSSHFFNEQDTLYLYKGTSDNPTDLYNSYSVSQDDWIKIIFVTNNIGNTKYYYRVRCSYNGVYGNYSSTVSSITVPSAVYARLLNNTKTSATFSISCSSSGSELTTHLKYSIKVAGGTESVVDTGLTNTQGSTITYTINNLSPNTNYVVTFYLENDSGKGMSSTVTFCTSAFYGPKSGYQTSSVARSNFTLSDTSNMGLYSKLSSSSNLNVRMYGDTEQDIATGVPNLFNINATPTWTGNNTSYSVSGRSLTVTGGWFVAFTISVKANTNYYISAIRSNISSPSPAAGNIFVYTGSTGGSNIFDYGTNGYFNTGNNTAIRVGFRCGFNDSHQGTATFTNIQLKEGTTELGYSEYNKISGNLMPLVPITNNILNWSQQATYEYVWDDELKRKVLHMVGTGNYPGLSFALSPYMTYVTGRNYAVSVRYKLIADGVSSNGGYGGVTFNGRNSWELLGNENANWVKIDNPDSTTGYPGSSLRKSNTWTTATVRTSKNASPNYTPNRITIQLREALYSGIHCEIWISDIEVREITDAEYAADTYTPTFTPYTNGYIAPSPDYSMPIKTVTGLQTINIAGSNGESQEYEINLGKNLFDGTYVKYAVGGGTGIYKWFANASSRSIAMPCEPNTTYTITKFTESNRFLVADYPSMPPSGATTDLNGLIQDNTVTLGSITVTTHSDAKYLLVCVSNDNTEPTIQIEKGSTSSSYAPYFTPIELCKIGTYQDYIYEEDGKWYLHKETGRLTLNGSETWSSTSAYTGYIRAVVAIGENHANNEGYCNEFINRGNQAHGDYEYVWIQPNTNTFYIQILQSRANSLATFKTWLASNPATIYYALATPTDTQITNQALIVQLNKFYLLAHAYPESTTFSTKGDLPILLNGNFPYTDGNDTSEKIVRMYGSVDGKTKRIKKLYGSVNGKTKLILNNN